MTTFWEDVKSVGSKLGKAWARACEEASWEEHRERNRKNAIREAKAAEKAVASGRYLSWDNPADHALLNSFKEIRNVIRNQGKLVSDNTPGDFIPATQTKGYRIAWQLGSAQSIFTAHKQSRLHPLYEETQARNRRVRINGASGAILTAPGLKIRAVLDDWNNAAFIRFDRGNATDLKKLHTILVPQLSANSLKID